MRPTPRPPIVPWILLPALCLPAAGAAPATASEDPADPAANPAASTAAPDCRALAEPGPAFGEPVAISDPGAAAYMPALAERQGTVLIAWQEITGSGDRVRYSLAAEGCVGPVFQVEDEYPNPRRPDVAATATGFVLAYEVRDTPRPMIRSLRLASDGRAVSGPDTVSAPGAVASRVRLASRGDDVVYSWSSVLAHFVARRGPVETLPPTAVGTALEAAGLVSYPRVALGPDGTLFLAYRDGGPETENLEVWLLVREPGEPFGPPINVSATPKQMSTDMALVVEPGGRLRIAWAEQNAKRVAAFEIRHAVLDRGDGDGWRLAGRSASAVPGLASFKPSVASGLATAWHTGTVAAGPMFFSLGSVRAERILPDHRGGMIALVGGPGGSFHLAFVDTDNPPRLRYSRRGAAPEPGGQG